MKRYRVYIDTHSEHEPLSEWVDSKRGAMYYLQTLINTKLYQGKLCVVSADFMKIGQQYTQITKEETEFSLFSIDERRNVQ